MKCPICGKEVELQKKQIGVDDNNTPIFHEYAICRDCKKQWDLDKQRAKKAAAKKAAQKAVPTGEKPVQKAAPAGEKPVHKTAPAGEKPVQKAAPAGEKPSAKKTSAPAEAAQKKAAQGEVAKKRPTQGQNAGKKSVPAKGAPAKGAPAQTTELKKPAPAARKTAASSQSDAPTQRAEGKQSVQKRQRPAEGKKRPSDSAGTKRPSANSAKRTAASSGEGQAAAQSVSEEQRYANIPPERVRTKREKAVRKGYEDMLATDPKSRSGKKKSPASRDAALSSKAAAKSAPARRKPDPEPDYLEDEMYEEDEPRFTVVKIIFSILSLLAFAFFTYKAFTTGLSDVTAGNTDSAGMIFIILALCLLLSGILLFLLRRKNTVFAFLLPAIFAIGGAVFAFLKRSSDSMLLYSAAGCAVFAVLFIILMIVSLGSGGDEYEDEYDDPFEEDHDNY